MQPESILEPVRSSSLCLLIEMLNRCAAFPPLQEISTYWRIGYTVVKSGRWPWNRQLHRVLSDMTGLSGLRILDAILAGERNPLQLAGLCHSRVKSSRDTVAKSLEGDYRVEHIFTLRQSLAGYRYYQGLIAEVDGEIQSHLASLETTADLHTTPPERTKKKAYQRQHYEPKVFDLRGELFRVFGVD